MVNFLSMPALKAPDNALIDFQGAAAPLTNALSGYRQGMNQQYGEQQRLEQQSYQRGRDAKADSRQQVEWFGKQAAAIDRIQDPAQRGAIWNRILSKHPDAANLGPEYRDPMNGPKLVAAEAGQWRDPREDQLADLKVQGARLDVQKAQRDLSQPNRKVVEVNGRLVEIGDGQAKEIYAAPEASGGQFGPYKDAKQKADVEEGLRKEYAMIAKPYFEVRDAFARVEQSAKAPSAAGDLALIFNYMKMLDPGSVVREGEFATAQNAAGVPDQVRNVFNRVASGERLNPQQRGDFVGQARGLMQAQERQYTSIQKQYKGIAGRIGASPDNVFFDFTQPQAAPQENTSQGPTDFSGGLSGAIQSGNYRWNPNTGSMEAR